MPRGSQWSVGLCLFVLAGSALVGGGCARHRATDTPNLPALPEQFATATPTRAPSPGWVQQFADPELDALVREAIGANHDLAAAAARLEAAWAEARIAGADRYPAVNATGSATRSHTAATAFSPNGIQSNSFHIGLSASWELDLWGRWRERSAAAGLSVEAVAADRAAAEQSLAAQCAKAWFAARAAAVEIALAEQLANTQQQSVTIASARFRDGLLGAETVRELRSAQASSENRAAVARITFASRIRQLEILCGRYPSGTLPCPANLPAVPPPAPAGIPATVIAQRPDLIASERRLRAALHRADASQADLYPRLSLTASGGRSSNALSDLLDADFSVWSLGANLLQPIFQGGRLRASRDRADAEARVSGEQFASAVLKALGEVETALATGVLLAERDGRQQSIVDESSALEARARSRHRAGLADALDLLAARRGQLEAELNALTIQQLRLENRVDVLLALGGNAVNDHQPSP
jgi:outer membrane protein, multidrug efflux system